MEIQTLKFQMKEDRLILITYYFVKIGRYASWTYDDKTDVGYCGYTPFMYSFVMLIIGWVTFPFLMCCCTFICLEMAVRLTASDTDDIEDPIFKFFCFFCLRKS